MKIRHFCLFITLFLFSINCISQDSELEKSIKTYIKGKKAIIGVAAIFDGKETIKVNNQYHYPTMSIYKFHLALAVLDQLDKKKLSLNTKIFVKKTDLLPTTHSPLRDENPNGNFDISIGDLLKYCISKSDNNACDILLKYVGGPAYVNKYVANLGIKETSISTTEKVMNESPENQYLNWTTPYSAAQILEIFLKQDLFSDDYKNFLEKIMIETTTGPDKIKALLPSETIVGHKTGSSSRNEFGIKIAENDLAFIKLPNGKQYILAIFVMNSFEDDKTNNSTIAKISKIVYDYFKTK